jgi:hypothetical protein
MRPSVSDSERRTERESRGALPPSRGTDAGGRSSGTRRFGGDGRHERGQTTLDFALGASLFLLALIGVLVFVSGTMEPFTEGSQEDIGVADRVADSLAEGLLVDPAEPHILDTTCTVEFFAGNSPADCRHSGSSLTERVGVKNWQLINVTMQTDLTGGPDEEVLCWDSTDERVVARSTAGCDQQFTVGPTPPPRVGDTVTARRVVSINGTDTTMRVEVW